MESRQRTFELIPTTLVNTDGPRRAMTSKAAKKAYLQRNRGPKISKAEQRRLEAEELARQKKEYERERAAGKAKAARDKKAAKEQAEKAERKKMGLPEPNKFVRASQPTISRFVKNGNKRIWQEIEAVAEESEGTICNQEEEDRPAKRAAAVDDDTEDEFGDFPSFSQSDLPEIFEKINSSLHKSEVEDEKEDPQKFPPRKVSIVVEDECPEDEDALADMVTTQLVSEVAEAANKVLLPVDTRIFDLTERTPRKVKQQISTICDKDHASFKPRAWLLSGSLQVQSPVIKKDVHETDSNAKTVNQQISTTLSKAHTSPDPPKPPRPVLQECSVNIPPPRNPINKKIKSISTASTPSKAKCVSLKSTEFVMVPSATQAFLENHLDDFFPSPSQQVRELLEDIDDLPSNTQIAKELSPRKAIDDDPYVDMISTQDLILSPQDLLEITTPSRPPPTMAWNRSPSPSRPVSRERRRFFEEKEEDMMLAALHESTIVEAEKQPREKEPGKLNRTLQRIQSTLTDYGDEEFNEQELLALC